MKLIKQLTLTPIFLVLFFLSGCDKKNELTMTVKWDLNIDNENISWEGDLLIDPITYDYTCTSSVPGICNQQLGGEQYSVIMSKGNQEILTNNDFNMFFNCSVLNKIGSTVITPNMPYDPVDPKFEIQSLNNVCSATLPNSNITINITEIIEKSPHTALVKGNFSGVIGKYSGGTASISGSFEAYNKF
jgi:hypothetical protein